MGWGDFLNHKGTKTQRGTKKNPFICIDIKTYLSSYKPIKFMFLNSPLHLTHHLYNRYYHFLQAYTAVLKSVAVIIYEVIIVVWIAQKIIFFSKNE